ncbi:aldehyde dehydrogenase family protein [Symbioplanes lichenis]|uniref:aldehyde dehydrogenase family protein n=1 Tax=Symbioplanes lichenis TaxID=1629072 RepID=UPI002739898C|nr:aldehyde dehydrogenase family protein [Actinoplanes lichenis]
MTAFYVAGAPADGDDEVLVTHPFDGRPVGTTTWATEAQVETAVAAAAAFAAEAAALPAHVRAAALDHVSRRIAERRQEIAELITAENGKPLKWALIEADRAVSVFRWAAEEARRFSGSLQRLDTDPGGAGRIAVVKRVPRGPVLGISPFNFPLNLVAHKVAPALAVGAPIVLKPAPATPLTALLLGSILAETGLPAGMFSILPVPNERAEALVTDSRLPIVSFTGSGPVGARIRRAAPDKHVTLELGGNAAVLVCGDYGSDEDLDWAATRIATFSNYQAGQSCIAVQRVFVHSGLGLQERLVRAVEGLRTGDPTDPGVDVGPMISEEAAKRVEAWVDEAVAAGATVLAGGKRDGATYPPTVLSGVPAGAKVTTEEVFGPVLVVSEVPSDEAGFEAINDSAYGLQAGVFTHNVQTAFAAHRRLEVGGVIVGDVPSYRADQMPYGGQKGSGVGREGVASAMEDYTEPRVMVLTGVEL